MYLHTNTCITYFSAYFSAASCSRCNINQKLPAHSYQYSPSLPPRLPVCTGKLENFSLRFIVKKKEKLFELRRQLTVEEGGGLGRCGAVNGIWYSALAGRLRNYFLFICLSAKACRRALMT